MNLKTTTPRLRNSMNHSRRLAVTGLLALVFVCFELSPTAQAVLPPPDGGYFNGNTAEGEDALFHLDVSSSHFDTAVGFHALFNDQGSGLNTAIGASALASNTSGLGNVAVGGGALANNLSAYSNTAVGYYAMLSNTIGPDNTACGQSALQNDTT